MSFSIELSLEGVEYLYLVMGVPWGLAHYFSHRLVA